MASSASILTRIRRLVPGMGAKTPFVTIVRLSGIISSDARPGRGLSAVQVEKPLRKAFRKRAAAVALEINSPGGAPVQSRMIYRRIRELAEEKDVPVIAHIADVGASGGYMIALAGDEIFADPFAIVGSIGVISAGFGFQEAIGKLGIERRVHTAGENKSQLDPFEPEDPEDVRQLESILTKSHALFVSMVRERRAGRLAAEEAALFDGRIFLAGDAADHGLIDGTGDLTAILKERFGDDVRLRRYDAEPRGVLGRLLTRRGAGLADDALDALERRGLWARFGL